MKPNLVGISSDAINRRRFLKTTAGTALGAAAFILSPSGARAAAGKDSGEYWSPKLSESVGSVDDLTLAWLAQMGCEWVVLGSTDWVDQDKKGFWTTADLEPVQERCRKFGMELYSLMIPIAWLMSPMLAKPDRDLWINNIQKTIIAAGKQGIQMLEWRWSPDFKPHGPGYGYYSKEGRGGATYKAFDYDRDGHLPPYPELGTISREEMWERLLYFCD